MQIMPATFAEIAAAVDDLTLTDRSNPGHSIAAGIYYDAWLWRFWADSIPARRQRLAFTFAAYNAGPGRVSNARDRCPQACSDWSALKAHLPEETRHYVPKIYRLMGRPEPH